MCMKIQQYKHKCSIRWNSPRKKQKNILKNHIWRLRGIANTHHILFREQSKLRPPKHAQNGLRDDGMWQTNYCCPRPSPQPRQRQVPIRRTRCSWSGSSCMRRCGGTSWRCGRQRPSWARRCNLRAPKLSRCAVFRVVFLAHRGRVADPPLLRFFLNNNKALNQQLAFVFFCFICFHRNSILFLGYLRLLTSQGIVSFFPLIGYEQIH